MSTLTSGPLSAAGISSDQTKVNDFSPMIFAIYGLPGSGKSTLLQTLRRKFRGEDFHIVDGADAISSICRKPADSPKAGLEAFKAMTASEKLEKRQLATKQIREDCDNTQCHGVVAGHYVFWPDEAGTPEQAWTDEDEKAYTHILYLKVDPEENQKRQANDLTKKRLYHSAEHLENWQDLEINELTAICREQEIPFFRITDNADVEGLIRLTVGGEDRALSKLESGADRPENQMLDTFLVVDVDKTLAAQDSGDLFCQMSCRPNAMKDIFGSFPDYTAMAFCQIAQLLQSTSLDGWDDTCRKIADKITIYPQFVEILQKAAKKNAVGIVVVTCGIGQVWEKVLAKHGLEEAVRVIGGGRVDDGQLVTPDVKKRVVEHLQKQNAFVWAFGDSQLDLPMLEQADQAIVVVCDEKVRSKSMEEKLKISITKCGLSARQMLLPSTVKPRLDGRLLPIVHAADVSFKLALDNTIQLIHATNTPVAKILAAPTRSASVRAVALQAAHKGVGYYLATEMLPKATGLEAYDITTVEDKQSKGHRIRNESETVIVSCMRGGDPLAQGIFEALSSAVYVHADDPDDLDKKKHREAFIGAKNILLCDFVINSGNTMVEFIGKIRKGLNKDARIVMMVGVCQAGALEEEGALAAGVRAYGGGISVVALRLSENKFNGQGSTDTGSRLFNTTKAETV